ncbi:AsmA family protein [Uliginosibacterium paludis]|uniref:AsmA family protein n=1 Tax=Uliginosibacterium paludis TaxID=1615952 RepID=A0ABV2CVI9_9RHOO
MPVDDIRIVPRWLRLARLLTAAFLVCCASFALGEWMEWRFLASSLEAAASRALDRPVRFGPAQDGRRFRLRLLGGPRLDLAAPTVASAGAGQPALLSANELSLRLAWHDLLAFRPGEVLRVRSLKASQLSLALQRERTGSANWRFPARATSQTGPIVGGLRFAALLVERGRLEYRDEVKDLILSGHFSLDDSSDASSQPAGLKGRAAGTYAGHPLDVSVSSRSLLAAFAGDEREAHLQLALRASSGPTKLALEGWIHGLFRAPRVETRFMLSGPSLAHAGAPLGVTLPVTPPFSMRGQLVQAGALWTVDVAQARIGRSELGGHFTFRQGAQGQRARLDGRLSGKALWLADLGPAVGTAGAGEDSRPRTGAPAGRVLPDRRFNIPALRAMDAEVRIALDRLELGTPALDDIRPLQARLLLDSGRLRIEDLDARLARGHLRGEIELDGRETPARWRTRMAFDGIALEDWIRAGRDTGPPRVRGALAGELSLTGSGNSTAEILGDASGQSLFTLQHGRISHLLIELAGLDVAQALGVFATGDKTLPVTCGVAALKADRGLVRPELFVLDTPDSLVRVSGGLSLATERMDLLARVLPKDFSPLALRTPIRIRGSLARPGIRPEAGPLVARLGASAALAALNPLTAWLPLIDPGKALGRARSAALTDADVCRILTARRTPPPAHVGQH